MFKEDIKRVAYHIIHPQELFMKTVVCTPSIWPDRMYLKQLFLYSMGKKVNLKKPSTFSEKLQWLKLYNRKPEYTMMVDKVKVKEYVTSVLGEEYIIPTLGVWDDPDKIDFDTLPEKFVLKCNHNSGTGMYICKDKSKMDVEKVKEGLRKGLKENYFLSNREWPYKNVPRRILAEKFIDPIPGMNDLPDYKFFCFGGEPKFCQVISGRDTKMSIDFFDKDWNHQPFHEPRIYPFAEVLPQRPPKYVEMWEAARKLAQDMSFVRIDFYNADNRVLFGEITFFPTGGMGGFSPQEWDDYFGSLIELPNSL